MRLIGHLPDESAARVFADFLYVEGIENQVEHERADGWGIWISDEDKIEHAAELLKSYRGNPQDPKYTRQGKSAAELREKEAQDQEAYRKRLRSRRHLFRPLTPYGFGPLTFVMICASMAIFAWSNFGHNLEPIMSLFITSFSDYSIWDKTLPEIRHGEIWRALTPIFIHFGWLHIIFNMLMLRDLGSMVEGRQSTVHLLVLTVVIGVGSNLAQFYWQGAPFFGGMSGVLYGLMGYIWIRGKLDPGSGLYLHSSTVTSMLVWFFLCIFARTGWGMPRTANWAHAAGLVMGMAWGYLSSLRYR
jgi:GlpG protein